MYTYSIKSSLQELNKIIKEVNKYNIIHLIEENINTYIVNTEVPIKLTSLHYEIKQIKNNTPYEKFQTIKEIMKEGNYIYKATLTNNNEYEFSGTIEITHNDNHIFQIHKFKEHNQNIESINIYTLKDYRINSTRLTFRDNKSFPAIKNGNIDVDMKNNIIHETFSGKSELFTLSSIQYQNTIKIFREGDILKKEISIGGNCVYKSDIIHEI
ncbi:hypothetical protein CPAV1605_672 [seawater metagenome]|uniref:Uncharacterized protein n=1 Tax=seawater metagenome TaxID=1561972 RepID=A0A5E8CIN8_9ZZZZ